MKRIALAMALIMISSAASAIQVILVAHNQTSGGGTISTLHTDGPFGVFSTSGYAPPSTAVWDWDGTTLTGTGFYGATSGIGDSQRSIIADHIQNLSIDTSTGTATATSYACGEGTFLAIVGFNGCGDYDLGSNLIDESTTVWSGLSVSQTISGDDIAGTNGPRTIAAYNFGLDGIVGVNGLKLGDLIMIGNGIALGSIDDGLGEVMTFKVVPIPAAFWLFGSALGLLGWIRRNTT